MEGGPRQCVASLPTQRELAVSRYHVDNILRSRDVGLGPADRVARESLPQHVSSAECSQRSRTRIALLPSPTPSRRTLARTYARTHAHTGSNRAAGRGRCQLDSRGGECHANAGFGRLHRPQQRQQQQQPRLRPQQQQHPQRLEQNSQEQLSSGRGCCCGCWRQRRRLGSAIAAATAAISPASAVLRRH
jgi:hypothetical protein